MTPSCLRVPPDRQSSLARAAGAAAGRGEARIQVRPRPRSVPGAAGRRRGAQGGFATLTSHRRAFKSCGAFGGRDLLSHASRSLQLGEIGPSCRANSMSRRDVNSCRFPIQPTIVRRRDRLLGFSLGCWPVSIATTVAIRRVGWDQGHAQGETASKPAHPDVLRALPVASQRSVDVALSVGRTASVERPPFRPDRWHSVKA